jgi:energy-coupling factor transport system permease protein
VTTGTLHAGPTAGDVWLARPDPMTLVAASALVGVAGLLALDPVTPALLLGATVLALALAGLPPATLARRTWPLAVSAGGVGLASVLAAGAVTADTLQLGLATAVRVVAVALPGIAVVLVLDPTRLADTLVQRFAVPPRFAYAALAALRLLPLLAAEWTLIGQARRARGLEAGRGPIRRLRAFAAAVLTLLVAALRRAVRLAEAMDARGLDHDGPRTSSRPQRWTTADAVVLVVAAATAVGAVLLSIRLGTFVPVWAA